jgi:hypothetical protein
LPDSLPLSRCRALLLTVDFIGLFRLSLVLRVGLRLVPMRVILLEDLGP